MVVNKKICPAFVIALLMVAYPAFGEEADKVYRSVGEDGVVEFSDTAKPNADEIKVQKVPTIKMPPASKKPLSIPVKKQSPLTFKIEIAEPQHDATIRDNQGIVTVKLNTQPKLGENHSIRLYLDDKLAAETALEIYTFNNMDRGTHNLYAILVDAEGKELARSGTVQFHLKRHSRLFQQPSAPALPPTQQLPPKPLSTPP